MKKPTLAIAAALAGATLGFGHVAIAQEQTATAQFVDQSGAEIGTATLTGTSEGVLVEAEVRGLPGDNWVGFHFHENGECDPQGGFQSAGGHFNPTGREHGYRVDGGPHAGDMPNQYVPADGVLRAHVFNSAVALNEGDAALSGRAIVIHAGADDYESQPSGDAGDRLACAIIE